MKPVFIGVDVGTGSARAGLFDADGRLMAVAKRPIAIWYGEDDVVEQSSDQIWMAVSESVREAVANANVDPAAIMGVGFDATCSLVAIGNDGGPVTVSPSGNPERNVIVWMDHRAAQEAQAINAGAHAVLDYVGGRISPEMQTPKLLWLKRNLASSFKTARHFFDLADYLTWRATGSLSRSVCTVTCKWTYLAHEQRWDPSYFRSIGLAELADEGFARIGTDVVEPGAALGRGLTAAAAADLGLHPGTPVGAALIDAHAGGVGTLAARIDEGGFSIGSRLAYVFGTSACSMASSPDPVFVPGVWGPYYSAMVPGLWLNEGGQSAAGAAIDHLVQLHPAAPEVATRARAQGKSLVEWLDQEASRLAGTAERVAVRMNGVHVVPEFLGNRSPLADPDARAVIAGLGLERDVASLVDLYLSGLAGVGYGLRQLLNRLAERGIATGTIMVSGGAARSKLVCQLLADATRIPVAVAATTEPVLLGSAMLAAVASGRHATVFEAMQAMSGQAAMFHPTQGEVADLHTARFEAFEGLQAAARQIRMRT